MTQIPGDPLGRLMEDLDGTKFSHSGIAVPCRHGAGCTDGCPPRIASALAGGMEVGADFGGIRRDVFTDFWPHRDLYCIPMTPTRRATALAFLEHYPERPGRDGTFAFTKLFTIAAALRARKLIARGDPRGPRILEAAVATATAWESTGDRPRFYCAEFAAAAYGRRFDHAELEPPADEKDDDDHGIGDIVVAVADVVANEWAATSEEHATRAALLRVLADEDLGFLGRALLSTVGSAAYAVFGGHGRPVVPDPLPPLPAGRRAAVAEEPLALPHALVTPRMLWEAFGRDTLCRIAQP